MTSEGVPPTGAVGLRTATRAWFRISLQTFGGPAGQLAVMQRTLVEEERWIGQRRFLHAMNYSMLLPGPEAQLYFAVHTLSRDVVGVDSWGLSLELPDLGTPRWVALAITAVAAVLLFRLRWSVLRTLGVCAALGLVAGLAGLPV